MWNFLYLTIELGGRCLVDLAGLLQVVGADCLKDAEYTNGINIGCELRGIEADLYVRLGCKVVDLGGLHLAYELDERHRVAHIGIVEVEIRGALKVGDTLTVINGAAADDAVNFIALRKKELTQIRTVLACNASDKGNVFLFCCHSLYIKFNNTLISLLLLQTILIPCEQFSHTILYFNFVRPTKRMKLAHINKFSHCSVWLVGIKEDFSLEVNCLNNQF